MKNERKGEGGEREEKRDILRKCERGESRRESEREVSE